MTCENCDPKISKPGRLTKVSADTKRCAVCGRELKRGTVDMTASQSRWDTYFHFICEAVASKSPCLSRKIGAILVRDKSVISTGYNGPPRGTPHCGHERWMKDYYLRKEVALTNLMLDDTRLDGFNPKEIKEIDFYDQCPRRVLGYSSGTHMELCPAQHAEENAISNAARLGVSVLGSTLYINSIIPCQKCFGTLVNAGIVEIVASEATVYDKYTQFLINSSNIKIRESEL